MARTFLRQELQIRSSDLFDDTLPASSSFENSGSNLQEDLNNIRSQIKRLYASGTGNWFDDLPITNGKQRGLTEINFDLDDVEEKRILFRTQVLTDVFVSGGANAVVLSGNEKPTEIFASGSTNALGAVATWLNATDLFGTGSLVQTNGFNPVSPKNLVIIRSSSGDPMLSNSKEIKGLLQTESGSVEGTNFNDLNQRIQISFVRENITGDDLELVPFADIEGRFINYSYVRRVNFDTLPEQAFLDGRFVDQVASVDVTLNNAIDNQMGTATQEQTITWDISDGFELRFTADSGATNMLRLVPSGSLNEIEINIDTFDINNNNPADFLNGASFDTGGTQINIGVSDGQIDSVGHLTMSSGLTFDTKIVGSRELFLDDGNKASSTWNEVNGIKLSETTADWNDFKSTFGEISLLEAITSGSNAKGHKKATGVLTAKLNSNINIRGGVNLDTMLLNYSGSNFIEDVNIYFNGQLLRNGVDASANFDVYPGDDPTQGDIKLEMKAEIGDTITMIILS